MDNGGRHISEPVTRHRPGLRVADARQRSHVALDKTMHYQIATRNPAHRRAMHALGRGCRKADVPARTQEFRKAKEQVIVGSEDDRKRPASATARNRK